MERGFLKSPGIKTQCNSGADDRQNNIFRHLSSLFTSLQSCRDPSQPQGHLVRQ